LFIKSEAKDAADLVLRSTGYDDVLPVDPVHIAQILGLNVFAANIGSDVSGMLRQEKGDEAPEIFLDVNDPPVRRRFSCAHELGHYMRHVGDESEIAFVDYRDSRSRRGDDPEEIFANNFAANLLMPEDKVRAEFATAPSPLVLARVFNVSLDAMTFRLKNLQLLS
jgi:Zn-dependent peptidase ImmA (M78 family)